jgi:hypothetical protein
MTWPYVDNVRPAPWPSCRAKQVAAQRVEQPHGPAPPGLSGVDDERVLADVAPAQPARLGGTQLGVGHQRDQDGVAVSDYGAQRLDGYRR